MATGFAGGAATSVVSGVTTTATVLEVADATWKVAGWAAGFAVADASWKLSLLTGAGRACGIGTAASFSAGLATGFAELLSEARRLLSGPFAITRSSCSSGMRGQCRTLPVSRWTKPDDG